MVILLKVNMTKQLIQRLKIHFVLHPTTNNNTLAAYVDMVTAEVKKRTKLDPLKTQMNIYTYCDVDTQTLASALGNGEKYSYSDEDMRMVVPSNQVKMVVSSLLLVVVIIILEIIATQQVSNNPVLL